VDSQVLRAEIKKRALQNAIRHGGKADRRAVISKLMGDYPELRQQASAISSSMDYVIAEVNTLSLDKQRELLEEIAPELLCHEGQQQGKKTHLPELPHSERVIMRFAPNPNGPATLGSARGIVVNSEYARRYDGTFILRFDDTDPQTKRPMLEAYAWYLEDCEWLGATPNVVVNASDQMELYYHYAEKLIVMGAAYVCTCSQQHFKTLKEAGLACPDRDNAPKLSMTRWKQMLDGHFSEKEAVLRIKTDITHKNPALRDWIGFRIVDLTHPRGLISRVAAA
jgi:glutamyl-tRNA synthetase